MDEEEEILDDSAVSYGDSMMDDSEQNGDVPGMLLVLKIIQITIVKLNCS